MDWTNLCLRSPIDRLARRVTSQKAVAKYDKPLTADEIKLLLARLERKHKLLKRVLGVHTKAQHKSLCWKYNKRLPQFRQAMEPRSFLEYVRVGRAIQILTNELAQQRALRRLVASAEQLFKDAG